MSTEIGDIYFAKGSCGIVTFPIGSLPAVQEIEDFIRIIPLSKVKEFSAYRPINVSQSVKNDAARTCFSKYAGVIFPSSKENWFSRIKHKPSYEMLYWYIHWLKGGYEYVLRGTSPETITLEKIREIVLASPELFEKVK